MCFPDSSVGKEYACNTGDIGLIPGLRRSTGEGIGYPRQYSWASLVAQRIKNLLEMWETWFRSLGGEKGTATHFVKHNETRCNKMSYAFMRFF